MSDEEKQAARDECRKPPQPQTLQSEEDAAVFDAEMCKTGAWKYSTDTWPLSPKIVADWQDGSAGIAQKSRRDRWRDSQTILHRGFPYSGNTYNPKPQLQNVISVCKNEILFVGEFLNYPV